MSPRRIVAILLIFALGCAGWTALGTATLVRSGDSGLRIEPEVEALWGGDLVQEAPSFALTIPGTERVRAAMPVRNTIDVSLTLDYRQRGLVWYPTFVCDFSGTYTVRNPETVAQKIRFHFPFPHPEGTYDRFSFSVDGHPIDIPVRTREGVRDLLELEAGTTKEVRVTYRTRGLREWRYRLDRLTGRVRDLALTVRAVNFRDIDYPEGTFSPTERAAPSPDGAGMIMPWKADDLITSQDIGVTIPERINPGPVAARMSLFAPVSLVFFFTLLATLGLVWKVDIHPMHYLFTTAGFFAFHLLFAYLVDHADVHLAFAISASTSLLLVTSYLAAALGTGFPWKAAATGQLFYLVLFSYTFFMKGYTGLVMTIGSVATLAVLMRVTARTDWSAFFGRVKAPSKPPAEAQAPAV